MNTNTNQTPVDTLGLAEEDWLWFRDELAFAWRAAQDEAIDAYRAWHESPGPTAYAVYRAAQDRADQAQDVLADAALAQEPGANAVIIASTI